MTATSIARPGRNEPCHCGSGRKYKHCCLEKDNAEASAARKVAAEAVEQSSDVSETPEAATAKAARSRKPQTHQPWKAAANTRGFGGHTRTPRKTGGARKAGSS
jgi:SEC-C motif